MQGKMERGYCCWPWMRRAYKTRKMPWDALGGFLHLQRLPVHTIHITAITQRVHQYLKWKLASSVRVLQNLA